MSESFQWSEVADLEPLSCSDDFSLGTDCSRETFEESSSGGVGGLLAGDNSSFSHDGSSALGGDSRSLEIQRKLKELETSMLGPNSLESHDKCVSAGFGQIPNQMPPPGTENWDDLTMVLSRGNLKEILYACARAVEDDDFLRLELRMSELRPMVSVSGDTSQRLAAYIFEGFVARLSYSGNSIYHALKCKEPASAELLSYMHILYEVCPYFKFGYMSANGAIANAVKSEKRIHIVDFMIAQGSQWITLIQALASRPGGPPAIRITGIDDSTSAYARGGGLEFVGQRLSRLAESCGVPFSFVAASVPASRIKIEDLDLHPDEAIAVNFPLMLHHIPDSSVCPENHRDRLIRLAKCLSPKVVTLVEQELNTNTTAFLPRFAESVNHYHAIFESIDAALPKEHKERINVEQHCLAREIVNIIACEGRERVERHEPLRKWRSRFETAGLKPYPLSSFVNATIGTLLRSYSEDYTLEEVDGALVLGWRNTPLITSCAWT